MPKNIAKKMAHRMEDQNLSTLDFRFAFEPEFIFTYTPDALRGACEQSNMVARLFVLRMGEMLALTPDTPTVERAGFLRLLSDRDWLQKMIGLARAEEAFNYDADESCYAELNATRLAKIAAYEAARPSRRVAIVAKEGGGPDSDKATADKKPEQKAERKEGQAEPEHFLHGFRKGQLQITNFITRCQILRVGARKKGRQQWTDDAPLIVRDVSGFKTGEVVISYSGQELRPQDIVTWSKVLHMAVTSPLGTKVSVSKAKLLSARGGGDSTNSANAAREEIERLQKSYFKVTVRCSRTIAAIAAGSPDDNSIQDAKKTGVLSMSFHLLGQTTTSGRLWTIHVEPVVRLLFGKGISSWFDERVYKTIKGEFAKRLYLLYYSHVVCYPLTLTELRKYLGSTMAEDSKFKGAVDAAHRELAKRGAICEGWKLEKSARRYNAVAYVVARPDRTDAGESEENAEAA